MPGQARRLYPPPSVVGVLSSLLTTHQTQSLLTMCQAGQPELSSIRAPPLGNIKCWTGQRLIGLFHQTPSVYHRRNSCQGFLLASPYWPTQLRSGGEGVLRQAVQQARVELQEEQGVDGIDPAVPVRVRALRVGQRIDEVSLELQDQ